MVLTRRAAAAAAAVPMELAEELVLKILFALGSTPHDDAQALARDLANASRVCSIWNAAASDRALWKSIYLRTSPVAHIVGGGGQGPDDGQGLDDGQGPDDAKYIVTPFNDPSENTPLLEQELDYRRLFRQRATVGLHGNDSFREHGVTWFEHGVFMSSHQPKFICTTLAPTTIALPEFTYDQLTFTFELFELDCSRQCRQGWLDDYEDYDEDCEKDDDFPKRTDYLTSSVREAFAGPPHFAVRFDVEQETENLIWASSVRPSPPSPRLKVATGPTRDERLKVPRDQTVPIDSGMDDYQSMWTSPYRLVVTVTRDTDQKMCQIVDVRGYKSVDGDGNRARYGFRHGFKELGGDTCTAGVDVAVVEDTLDAFVYFGPNAQYGGFQALVPKANGAPDDAFDTFLESGGYESSGILTELSLSWKYFLTEDEEDLAEEEQFFREDGYANATPERVAKALARLEWH